MHIEMIKTVKGSPDGLRVLTYEQGKKYTLPDDLGNVFVEEMKAAKLVKPKKKQYKRKTKTIDNSFVTYETNDLNEFADLERR